MIPAFGRRRRWLALTLAGAALLAGCGGGGAADDAVKGAAKVISGGDDAARGGVGLGDDAGRGLNPGLQQSAPRAEEVVQAAFCEGWNIYKAYGGFPSGDEWYEIALSRTQTLAYPPSVSRVVSSVESVADAYESGNVTAAQLDVYCQFA
jgi:hypothetical protein